MAIRQFTILALVFFAIVSMAFAASDAPAPSASPKAGGGEGDAASGATTGGTGGSPAAAADGATAGSPTDGPASDASIFKVSIIGAFVNFASAALFFY